MDINLKKAISLAIPYKKIIKSIYNGHATAWKGLVPSSVKTARDLNLGEENINLAKTFMNKSKHKNVTYDIIVDNSNKECIEIASLIKKAVSKINITLNIQPMPRKNFKLKQMENNFEMSLDQDLYRCNEIGYVLPHDFGDKKHGITNWTNYNNQEINLLFSEAKNTINYNKRIEMYDNVQNILANELPWIPIVQPTFNILHKNTIYGFDWSARLSGYPRYSDLIYSEKQTI
jgi:peptide/nickel transport system substrate-binding protein